MNAAYPLPDYSGIARKAREEAKDCPHCLKPVHPNNWGAHMAEYHAFDYTALDTEARIVVQQKTTEIRERLDTIQRCTTEIGLRLAVVKQQLGHGSWAKWVACEMPFSLDTADRLTNVGGMTMQNPQFAEYESQFDKSALYLLAKHSTPQAVRDAAIDHAQNGNRVSHSLASELIESKREARQNRLAAALETASPRVIRLAAALEVDDPEQVVMMIKGDKQHSSWLDDLERTGYIQIADEHDAVSGKASTAEWKRAIEEKQRQHIENNQRGIDLTRLPYARLTAVIEHAVALANIIEQLPRAKHLTTLLNEIRKDATDLLLEQAS